MKQLFSLVIIAIIATSPPAKAQEEAAREDMFKTVIEASVDTNLNDFLWVSRPVVVFADSDKDPRFKKQMLLIEALISELALRDVVVITDTDPKAKTPLRQSLRPRGFMLVLIGKDGTILLRKPIPWTVRELTRSIDKLPARQQEMRDRRVTPE